MPTTANTIMSVAIELFYKKGYFATSLSDIARLCGIKKASLYYHYPKKEDLLKAILVNAMQAVARVLDEALAGNAAIDVKLARAIAAHVDFHIKHQKEVLISDSELRGLSPDNRETIIAMRKAYEARIQALIAEGVEAKVFARTNVKVASYAILTLCSAVANWYRTNGPLTGIEIIRVYQDLILNGLREGKGLRFS
jgi:AcrR family transcriptional regulator